MGLEPLRAEAKRTIGRGPQRATGAPSVGVSGEIQVPPFIAENRN